MLQPAKADTPGSAAAVAFWAGSRPLLHITKLVLVRSQLTLHEVTFSVYNGSHPTSRHSIMRDTRSEAHRSSVRERTALTTILHF